MRQALLKAAQPAPTQLEPQPTPPSPQPSRNRGKYAAAGVVLALAIGLVMFLNRNSSPPAQASSEATSLSLAPTPTSSVADSPTPHASQSSALQSFTEDLGNSVKLEMVRLPGGTFEMGSNDYDDEKPPHQVKVDAFAIGKYEVAQAQWQAVIGNNPSHFKGADLPVESVSWDDAVKFCQTLSNKTGKAYRLPTEAEWEYAARAGSQTKYSFGDDANSLGEYAWFNDNSGGKTHPVGQKKPNAFGLYDLQGNIWEWVQDWYGKDYYQQRVFDNPKGPPSEQYRGLRGGSWGLISDLCRSAYRRTFGPFERNVSGGLRVVVGARTS
jgi:formylglycine-generating enzyme required for sulfatase activity